MFRRLCAVFLLCSSLAFSVNPIFLKAHKSTHKIDITPVVGLGGSCSGTAIGPHALLTASHCTAPATSVEVDGKPVDIISIESDGLDHSIYLLGSQITFEDYADVTLNSKNISQGDDVFVIGNPGGYNDLLRKGYVSGFDKQVEDDQPTLSDIMNLLTGKKPEKKRKPLMVYYDFNGFFGDSGSGIFDPDGKIIAVTSFITGDAAYGFTMKYMGSYEPRLTQEQLDRARNFEPPKSMKEPKHGSVLNDQASQHN